MPGPRQSPTYVTSSFARQIAEIEAGRREPVLRVGNLERAATSPTCATPCAPTGSSFSTDSRARPYNVCSGQAYRVRDLLDALVGCRGRQSRSRSIPTRLRPSDNPVIAGDRSRISAETGWAPEIPIEQTLDDLLDYWRRADSPPIMTAHAALLRRQPSDSSTSRWARSRCCCAT